MKYNLKHTSNLHNNEPIETEPYKFEVNERVLTVI
jgi:hypothetical protein